MKTAIGLATAKDPEAAGRLAAERALAKEPSPDVAILFASSQVDPQAVHRGVQSALGETPIFGGSSDREITNLGLTEKTVCILLMSGDKIRFRVLGAKARGRDAAAVAEDLVGTLEPSTGAHAAFLVGDELDPFGTQYLAEVDRRLGRALPVCGGGSVGSYDVDETLGHAWQFGPDGPMQNSLAALHMEATDGSSPFHFAFDSQATQVAPPVVCTATDGNKLVEVDGKPIEEFLERYLGPNWLDLITSGSWKYTFHAKLPEEEGGHWVVRVPRWSEGGGIRIFPGDDLKGLELRLVVMSRSTLLQGVRDAAERLMASLDGRHPQALFVSSCLLRRRFLHTRADHEVRILREVIGDDIPILGLYATGEYAPMFRSDAGGPVLARSRQLSTSLSLTLISSETPVPSGPPLSDQLRTWVRNDWAASNEKQTASKRVGAVYERLRQAEAIIDNIEESFLSINNSLTAANGRNAKLQQLIRQYTPHSVWERAHDTVEQGDYTIPDQELTPTLMFLDVKGFTAYSENHTPQEVIFELNRIFHPATAIIYRHRGDVDKYIGDCIFAVFRDPTGAVDAALEIHQAVAEFIGEGSPFSIRIGINRGRVVMGNVGGDGRRDNTLIGDAVNMAQRLESACTPGKVLVSQDVYSAVEAGLGDRAETESRTVALKGKAADHTVFELTPKLG